MILQEIQKTSVVSIFTPLKIFMEYPLPIEFAEFNYYEDKAIITIFFTFNFSDLQKGLTNNYLLLNKKSPNFYPKPEEYLLRTNVLMYRLNDLLKDPEHQLYLHILLKDIEQSEKQHKQEEQPDTHEVYVQEDKNYGNFKVVVNLNPMKNNAKQYTTRKVPLIQSSDLISERCYQALIEVTDTLLQIDLGEEDCTCLTAHCIPHFDPQLFELYLIFARHNKILDQITDIQDQIKEINKQSKHQEEVIMRNLLFKMNLRLKQLSEWKEQVKQNIVKELQQKFNTISDTILLKYENYTTTSVRSTQTIFEQQVGILLENTQRREEAIKKASQQDKQPNDQLLALKKKFLDQYSYEYSERYNINTAINLFVKSIQLSGISGLGCTGIGEEKLVNSTYFGRQTNSQSRLLKSQKQGKQLDQQQQLLQQQNYQICTKIIASNILDDIIRLDKSIYRCTNIKLTHLKDILQKCNIKDIIKLQKMRGVSFKDFKSTDIKESLYLVEFANKFAFDSTVKVENYIFPQEMLNQYVIDQYKDFSEKMNNLSLDQLYQLKEYEIIFPNVVQELKDQLLNSMSTKNLTKQVTFKSEELDLDTPKESTDASSTQLTLLKRSPTQIYNNKAQLLIDQYGLDKLDIRALKKKNQFPKPFKLISTKYGAYIDECQVLFTGFDHDVQVCTDKVQISQNGNFLRKIITFNFHIYNFKLGAKNIKLGFIFNGFFQILLSNDGIIQLTGNKKLEMDVCFFKLVTIKLNFQDEYLTIITDNQQTGPKNIQFKDIFVFNQKITEDKSEQKKEKLTNAQEVHQYAQMQNMLYERDTFQQIVQKVQHSSKNQFRDEVSQQLYNCSIQVQMSVYQIKNCSKEDEYTFIQSIQL